MKTTIEVSDPLLREAKRVARHRQTTLRALIEEGLRRVLEDRDERTTARFRLRDASVRGKGLQPDIRAGDWIQLRAMIYEGRGG